MKLKFKTQDYQTDAVDAVVDCFAGQPRSDGISYRIDPGRAKQSILDADGFKNADLAISKSQVLENIQKVQRRQNLPISDKMITSAKCHLNLDIEMETGTGKTYCYIKTIFEMNKRYGWSKFIIMVPSIAIREGVQKSLQITADHFAEVYHKKARFFTYNSKRLHELESFSSDAGINVMIINTQAFAARGKDQRRIYMELDDFQSRRPIDVISRNRPILILDEPQKMEGQATMRALEEFNPLTILRYSATHKTQHNKVHRLDALDAFNQKLVKKILVRGIKTRGLAGADSYIYLEGIEVSKKAPIARLEMEVKLANGDIKRQLKRLRLGKKLFDVSGCLPAYKGFTISQIDANKDVVEFSNGKNITVGESLGDISKEHRLRIQIRETIRAHLEKEQTLFEQGIKVLSLFFIDNVAKYRDYNTEDTNGEYARIFEEEYKQLREKYLKTLPLEHDYRTFLERSDVADVHDGYFSIDKKKQMVDPKIARTGENKGLSNDEGAYDLILRNKEKLLSQKEPVRFIFSHSALREGWDNPNVFTICMLKNSDNTISRRQEVGRGLRLSVNQKGERMDNPAIVHDINVLTVVANESYEDFVKNLQKEISEAMSSRPKKANEEYFRGKVLKTTNGEVTVTPDMAAQIEYYLIQNGYVDHQRQIVENYHSAKSGRTLAELPDDLKAIAPQVIELIDSVFSEAALSGIVDDGRKLKKNPLNDNFKKEQFKELWSRINRKAVFKVDFDSDDLVKKCVEAIDSQLNVTPLQYIVETGGQTGAMTQENVQSGQSFKSSESRTQESVESALSSVKYDLLHEVCERTQLTRKTVANIFHKVKLNVFKKFQQNPEQFISETSRLIKEQKATTIVERLSYNAVEECYDTDIFTAAQTGNDFSKVTEELNKHIYNYAIVDSEVEREFVAELEKSSEVTVYSKLPRGFLIPTPVGDYNPDWAISFSFEKGTVKHIYFVAETKGSMSKMALRTLEDTKIECAKKFFGHLGEVVTSDPDRVRYDVVDSYDKLMDLVTQQ